MKNKCACCGFKTISEMKDICPVCNWVEDSFQEEFINDDGGPNTTSLVNSRENFKKYGCCNIKYKNYVRQPTDEERDI